MGLEHGHPIVSVLMAWGLTEWRDVMIIAAGGVFFLALLAILIFTIVVGIAARTVLGSIQTLLRGEVAPILDSVRLTLQRVEGTAAFVSETAVSPVIRVYSVVAGARRMAGVLSGVTGRKKRRE